VKTESRRKYFFYRSENLWISLLFLSMVMVSSSVEWSWFNHIMSYSMIIGLVVS